MKKALKTLPAIALIVLTTASAVQAEDRFNRSSVYAGPAYFDFDEDHVNDNDEGGFVLGAELALGERWSTQLEQYVTDVNKPGSAETAIDYYRLGMNYHTAMLGSWQPYVGFGYGYMDIRDDITDNRDSFDLALGVKRLFREHLLVRTDLRAIENIEGGNTRDYILSLSAGYAFGARSTPARTPSLDLVDSDGDGVPDGQDSCRNTPAGTKVDSRGCELDDDRDGVVNSRDTCPATPVNLAVDTSGCPITEVVRERRELAVRFEYARAAILPAYAGEISEFAGFMKSHDEATTVIEGHTDSRGSDSYNQRLSQQRAEAVRDAIISEGVAAERLTARGYGESRPVADNSTDAGRAENRRIEAVITVEETVQRTR